MAVKDDNTPYEHAMTSDAVHPFAGWDVAALIEARGRQRGGHLALVWAPFEGAAQMWSYKELAEAVARIAGGLSARGIGAGDRVLLHLENCPETILARFACAWLGAVAVLSNVHLTAPELARIVAMLRPRAAITQPYLADAVGQSGSIEWIALASDPADRPMGSSVAQIDQFARLYGEPLPRRAPDPTAAAMILFTTGSTAAPKAVLWTHGNLLWAGKVGALQQGLGPGDVYQNSFAALSRRWVYLVARSGALGRSNCGVTAALFSEPILAGSALPSGHHCLPCRNRWISSATVRARPFIPSVVVRRARP